MRRAPCSSLVGPSVLCSHRRRRRPASACPPSRAATCRSPAAASSPTAPTRFGGTFGYGAPKGLYGKAGIGTTSYDGLDGSSFDFGLAGGYQIPLETKRTAEVCPVASLSIGSGPNDVAGSGIDLSSRTFAFGASLGALVNKSSVVQILPNAAFQFANTRATIDDGTTSTSGSESYGLLTLGTGFVFHSRFSVNPSISIPVGLDGSSTSFGLGGAINFGR